MFCKNCGREIEDKSKFCGYCGTRVTDFAVNENEAENIEETQEQEERTAEEECKESIRDKESADPAEQEAVSLSKGTEQGYSCEDSQEFQILGIRKSTYNSKWRLFATVDLRTKIEIQNENLDVTSELGLFRTRKNKFKIEDIERIYFKTSPVWFTMDVVAILIGILALLPTWGMSIFFCIYSAYKTLTRNLVLVLHSGEKVAMPVCQDADAVPFLRYLHYSEDVIQEITEKKIPDDEWKNNYKIKQVIYLLIAMALLGFGIWLGSGEGKKLLDRWTGSEKKDLIVHLQDFTTADIADDAYIFRCDKPAKFDVTAERSADSLKSWSIYVYPDDNRYIEFEDDVVYDCAVQWFGEEGVPNGDKAEYYWDENVVKIGLDFVGKDNLHNTELSYWLEAEEYTITADGEPYYISDKFKEHLDSYDLTAVLEIDLEVIKTQLLANSISFDKLMELKYTDLKKYNKLISVADTSTSVSDLNGNQPDGNNPTANVENEEEDGSDEKYLDQTSGLFPVTLENIRMDVDDSLGSTDFIYDVVNHSETSYKKATFNLYLWDADGEPIASELTDECGGYMLELYFNDVAADASMEDYYVTLDMEGIGYYNVFLVEAEDEDGNIWENPMKEYAKEQYAGNELDLETMTAFSADETK